MSPKCSSNMPDFEISRLYPCPKGHHFDQWYAESIIFGSGRPTLIVPHTRKSAGAFALDTVVVAWDFSRPAARAIGDALPILEKAKRVCVVTVTNEKVIDAKRSGAELAQHLARHGVDVGPGGTSMPLGAQLVMCLESACYTLTMLIFSSWEHMDTLVFEISFWEEQPKACFPGRHFPFFSRTDRAPSQSGAHPSTFRY